MSTTGESPGLPGSELDGDDEAVFDEFARRAGAALRRPAPADGVRAIAARQRRQQALKVSVVGGVAVVALIGALTIVSNRETPEQLPPVDSVPEALPTPTVPAPTTPASIPIDSSPATISTSTAAVPSPSTVPTASAAVASLWVELEPGGTAPLPPAPIRARNGSAVVWTGTELIVWGGIHEDERLDDGSFRESQEGAAFDPAAGTWRQISPPPDGVTPGVVLWTGIEMLVWRDNENPGMPSAAYDPSNDTWRLIADPPVLGSAAIWIGDAAVLLRHPDAASSTSFAYDPATDEWRRLAEGPWGRGVGWVVPPETSAVWTDTTIITMTDSENGILLNGYDPATDTWRVLEGFDNVKQPVVIPGSAGAAATVAFLPLGTGTPVELTDGQGNSISAWAGRPTELASTCSTPPSNDSCLLTSLRAASVGGEVLFWLSPDGWAFDPEAQTWRSLPLDGRQPGYDGTEVVAAGDLLFVWGDDRDGLVYRAATPG